MQEHRTAPEPRGRSIFVPLAGDALAALQAAARRDDRTVKGQAAHLIRRALEADGLLEARQSVPEPAR